MQADDHGSNNTANSIPIVVIIDQNTFVTTNKIIAKLVIKGPHGEQTRPLIRTKKGGYMMQ